MKLTKLIFPLGLLIMGAISLQAQTVDEIINKHIAAIGGKEKLSQIKSLYTEGSLEVMGNQAPMTTTILNGKGFRNETDFNGSKIIRVVTDQGGWGINPMAGAATAQPLSPEEIRFAKDDVHLGGALFNYQARGSKAELQGKENGNYIVKLTAKDSAESLFYIDSASYLINKSVVKGFMQGQQVDITTTFSDYKKTDFGNLVPYAYTMDLGGFSLSAAMKKVEVNKEVDPKIFEMPK